MRVAVTGGAGFIGANLCRHLRTLDSVEAVVVVDDLSTGDVANLDGVDVELVEGSILDAALLDRAFEGMDAVVHLAALPSVPRSIEDPMASHEVNATGTVRVLEAARGAGGPHVVVASSSSVYGSNSELPKHEGLRVQPMSPYAASKLAAESYALSYAACFDLPVLAFRFFNVFGPLQAVDHAYAAVIPVFVRSALAGEPVPVQGDGEQTRDFTYVGSVCEVIGDALLRRMTSANPVNLAFGSRRSLLDVIGEMEVVLGRRLDRQHGPARLGDVRDSQADGTHLHQLFPELLPVPFAEGIQHTIAWFRSSSAL